MDKKLPETTKSGISVKAIDNIEALLPMRDFWRGLYNSANCMSPTMTFSWIYSFLENPPDKIKGWKVLFAYDNNELIGILPVVESGSRFRLGTPFDWHTISVDFLLMPGREIETIGAMIEHLSELYPKWSRLVLHRIPESSPVVAGVKSWPSNSKVLLEFNGKGSYARMLGTFESYYSGLSKNFRKNLKKSLKNIDSLPSINLKTIKGRDITIHDIERFLGLESSGWKGQSGSAIEKSSRLTAFYKAMCHRLADDKILEWHFLQTETGLLAAKMVFRIGDRLTVNKIAYNESFAHYSPGNYLFLKTVENAYKAGDIKEIDCLTDMPWHRNWELDQRDYYDIYIFPRNLSSLLINVLPLKIKLILKKARFARTVKNNLAFF